MERGARGSTDTSVHQREARNEPPVVDERPVSGWLVAAVIATTSVVALPRLTPIGNGDFLSFVSVCERLRAGDRLYADVWDNKDPFFYYTLSAAANLGGWAYYLLEVAWVGLAVVGLLALARSQGFSRRWSTLVTWGAAPWCLLGVAYAGSMSVMPGVALTIVAIALAARGRWAGVGATLGVLVLLKITLVPVALAGAVVLCTEHRRRAVLRSAAAGAAATCVGLAVLALRGELLPYLSMLRQNSRYAERMVDAGGLDGFLMHLGRAFPSGTYPGERIALAAIVGTLALSALRRRQTSRLWRCAAAVLLSSLVVLGLTAVWSHHALLLAVAGALSLLTMCEPGPPQGRVRQVSVVAVSIATAYLLGGAAPLGQVLIRPDTAWQPLAQVRGPSPEAASIANVQVSTYSRLGRNDRDAHARGLDELRLACRDFQQYPFDPDSTFQRTLSCLPRSDVVFVSDNFADQEGPDGYSRFTREAAAILESQFTCTPTTYGRRCLRDGR